MSTVRAKFTVTDRTKHASYSGEEVVLHPMYDSSIPEDQRFAQTTPSGKLTMHVDNPTALEELALGRIFYLDFTPVEPMPGPAPNPSLK